MVLVACCLNCCQRDVNVAVDVSLIFLVFTHVFFSLFVCVLTLFCINWLFMLIFCF